MPHPLISFLLILIFCIAFAPNRILADADTGWHIMAGKYMAETREIPHLNVFSHSAGNYEWLNISWLWDLLAGWLYDVGGLYLLAVFTIYMLALTAYLLAKLCFFRGAGMLSTAETFIAAIVIIITSALIRPHVATNLLVVVALWAMYHYRQKGRTYVLWLVPPLFLLWANLHGGFIAGITIIGAFTAERLFNKDWRKFACLAICLAASLAVTFINPLGAGLYEGVGRTLFSALQDYVIEWGAPTDPTLLIYPLFLTVILIFGFRSLTLAEILLCGFWLVMGLASGRNLQVLVFVTAPAAAAALQGIILKYERLKKQEMSYQKDMNKPAIRNGLFVVAVLLAALMPTGMWQKAMGFDINKQPHHAGKEIEFAMRNYPQHKFFNSYNFGGSQILISSGKMKTFIDGRAETAFPSNIVQDYLSFEENKPSWPDMLGKYQINGIIIGNYYTAQAQRLDAMPEWEKVFTGDKAVVYVKN